MACQDAAFFARFYKEKGLKGGHIILLNPPASGYYDETKRQALEALQAYPGECRQEGESILLMQKNF